jgi:hypothetical protein
MQLAPEIVICRLLILYAMLHIVVLIKDIYEYKTSCWNIKYFLKDTSLIICFLKVDIILVCMLMSVSFLLFGDFFYLFSLLINQL